MTVIDAPAALEVQTQENVGALEDLRAEWAELWERCPYSTPFQSPEWLLAWWRHFGGAPAWTVTLRRGGRLVGLAQFYVYTHPDTGIRQVTLVGNGITDRLDVLVDASVEDGGARILEHLAENRHRWDTADFADLHPDSPLLAAPAPGGIRDAVEECASSPVLALPPDEEHLRDAIPQKLLTNLRHRRRRMDRAGRVEIARVAEHEVQAGMDALFALHARRWEERAEPGVLDDPAVRAFHREVAAGFAGRGWLRLYTLRLDGRTVAVHYGFTARHRAYYYIGGFDPGIPQLSPGNLVVEHAIRDAVREGVGEFDFLRGHEPYKYLWGAQDRPLFRRRLWSSDFSPSPGSVWRGRGSGGGGPA